MNRYYSSSSAASRKNEPVEVVTAITSVECKHVSNDENLVKWFLNRTHTCESLRLRNAGQKVRSSRMESAWCNSVVTSLPDCVYFQVTLVGWTEKKKSRFVHLCDGHGSTQILVENDDLNDQIDHVEPTDLLLVHGRVLARPQSHITHNNVTGEIELYAEVIKILDPKIPYEDVLAEIAPTGSTDQIVDDDIENGSTDTAEVAKAVVSKNFNEFTYRSHSCGELREKDIGKTVTVCGWLEFSRLKRFFTLRDAYGHTQVIIPEHVRLPLRYL